MAPPSADVETAPTQTTSPTPSKLRTIPEIKKSVAGLTQSASFAAPLEYSGSLDAYESFDVTNVIGREFPKLQISDILNDDAKIRDLAIIGTSEPQDRMKTKTILTNEQSVNVESFSSETRISILRTRRFWVRS